MDDCNSISDNIMIVIDDETLIYAWKPMQTIIILTINVNVRVTTLLILLRRMADAWFLTPFLRDLKVRFLKLFWIRCETVALVVGILRFLSNFKRGKWVFEFR